jgi:serine/threonine-protein kinase HipA
MANGPLTLWMNGALVGRWWSGRGTDSRLEYAPEWMSDPRGRPLSLSLPFTYPDGTIRGELVDRWFDNLLPDSDAIRGRLALRHRVSPRDSHALLGAIGRDCVGALQIVPEGEAPGRVDSIRYTALTDEDVASRLLSVPSARPFGQNVDDDDTVRISIAGAQEKTALLRHDGQWCVAIGATPTTHIFKLPLGEVAVVKADFSTSVENEWLCLTLLRAMGLRTASSEIGYFPGPQGDVTALIVERFDRMHTVSVEGNAWIARLPQEDCCQVSGTASSMKYESDGGPGVSRILDLLANSDNAATDVSTFVRAQLAFWLLAAPDGHAKNFSIAMQAGGRYSLRPLYDVLSAWPIIGHGPKEWNYGKVSLAMGIRGTSGLHRHLHKIHVTHWKRLAASTGVPFLFESMVAMVDALPATLAQVEPRLPAGFPVQVWERIRDGLLAQRERFQAALMAGES